MFREYRQASTSSGNLGKIGAGGRDGSLHRFRFRVVYTLQSIYENQFLTKKKTLDFKVRQRVLVSAFMRAIKDTFPPARGAGVLALATTQQYFLLSEVANRILPALCTLTVDPDKTVRDHTFKTLRGFLGKLERVSEDPSLRERMGNCAFDCPQKMLKVKKNRISRG